MHSAAEPHVWATTSSRATGVCARVCKLVVVHVTVFRVCVCVRPSRLLIITTNRNLETIQRNEGKRNSMSSDRTLLLLSVSVWFLFAIRGVRFPFIHFIFVLFGRHHIHPSQWNSVFCWSFIERMIYVLMWVWFLFELRMQRHSFHWILMGTVSSAFEQTTTTGW